MGVKGLTTYIARYAEKFLQPHELRDCDLVVDGDNLASQIHRWVGDCNAAYGGDYDYYYRQVYNVFNMFRQCNVNAYVLMDGGYERRKIRTVKSRFRSRIAAVKHIGTDDNKSLFPLMMREVFIEAVRDCGVKLMRCLYEADDEIAIFARKINCPVLSYDSDFYIHNVMYIPISSVTFRVYKKVPHKNDWSITTYNMKHRVKAEKLPENGYFFIDCCLYETKNLLIKEFATLKLEMLPLFAVILGNDYFQRSLMNRFYKQITVKKCGKGANFSQRRIHAVLHWLKGETMESAIRKILGHIPRKNRSFLIHKMNGAMASYTRIDSESFRYLGFEVDDKELKPMDSPDASPINIDPNTIEDEPGLEEYVSSSDEEDCNEEEVADETPEELDSDVENEGDYQFPKWFKRHYMKGEFSRFFVNLLTLKLYISTPQIEDFEQPDSNLISEDILMFIYSLLHSPDTPPQLLYMTRSFRGHSVKYMTLQAVPLQGIDFDPEILKNSSLFHQIFQEYPDVLMSIDFFSENQRLLILAIFYLSQKSKCANTAHIQSLLLAFLFLTPMNNSELFATVTKADQKHIRNRLQHFCLVSAKSKKSHSTTTYNAIHPFAEFQSIVFNLNALNALLNYPYAPVKMHEIFNGTFLYNMYINLKGRNNIHVYITTSLLSTNYASLYTKIIEWCKPFMPQLVMMNAKKRGKIAIKNDTRLRKKKIVDSSGSDEPDVEPSANSNENSDDDFNDVNNKFSILSLAA